MPWIKLNVGGQVFETELSTLLKFKSSSLAKIFESDILENNPDPAKMYYLDEDPQIFQAILCWLRYGLLPLPTELDKRLVILAAKHLGLDEMADSVEREHAIKSTMTDWIKLNVGGKIFETSRATLTSHQDSSLARMFEPNSNLPPATITSDGVYLVDACPVGFSVVLNWLRYRRLMLGDSKPEDVLPLADFFGLEDLQNILTKYILKKDEMNSKLLTCMEDGVDRLEYVLEQVSSEINAVQDKMDDIKIEVASISTGLEDLWRIKCEVANLGSIMK